MRRLFFPPCLERLIERGNVTPDGFLSQADTTRIGDIENGSEGNPCRFHLAGREARATRSPVGNDARVVLFRPESPHTVLHAGIDGPIEAPGRPAALLL